MNASVFIKRIACWRVERGRGSITDIFAIRELIDGATGEDRALAAQRGASWMTVQATSRSGSEGAAPFSWRVYLEK